MKKILALTLSLVLLFVMAAPAMAAGGEDAVSPYATCNGNHTLVAASERSTYAKYSETHHRKTTYTFYVCAYCTYSTETGPVTTTEWHSGGTATTAVCNGTTQLWRYSSCSKCSEPNYRKDKACPGGPHTGVCQWI